MFTTNYKQVDKKISVKTLCWFSKIIVQALIDYNSQHLPELRLLYHNSARCKWTFSHNLNFLRKKPFIFIKNYTFYFGKYITTYYLLMCRILQFPICVATETPLRIVVVGLPESIFQIRFQVKYSKKFVKVVNSWKFIKEKLQKSADIKKILLTIRQSVL